MKLMKSKHVSLWIKETFAFVKINGQLNSIIFVVVFKCVKVGTIAFETKY